MTRDDFASGEALLIETANIACSVLGLDGALVSVISIAELTQSAQQVNTKTYSTLETYLLLAAGYLVLTIPISLYARWLERRFHYET